MVMFEDLENESLSSYMKDEMDKLQRSRQSSFSSSRSSFGGDDDRRTVRFAFEETTIPIPSREDIKKKHIRALWYSTQETRQLKNDAVTFMKSVRRTRSTGASRKETEDSARGLEHLESTHHYKRLEEVRKTIVAAILEEQENQRNMCMYSPNDIATVAMKHSIKCRARALARGERDADAVREENAPFD